MKPLFVAILTFLEFFKTDGFPFFILTDCYFNSPAIMKKNLKKLFKRTLPCFLLLTLSASVFAQKVHKVNFTGGSDVLEALSQTHPLYLFSGNTFLFRDETNGRPGTAGFNSKKEREYKVVFPENFEVEDTAFTFIFFQGWENPALARHTLVLVGNYQSELIVIPDSNHNLDFSDDQPLKWSRQSPAFTFELPHSAHPQAKVVVKTEKIVADYDPAADPNSARYFAGLPFAKNKTVPAAYWWEVKRINSRTTTVLIGDDSVQLSLLDGTGDGLYNDLQWDRVAVGADLMGGHILEANLKISINGQAYRVKEVEATGKYLLLEDTKTKMEQLKEGSTLPDFVLENFSGDEVDLHSMSAAKPYILLDFWGTWCKPCIANTEQLKTLHQKYRKLMIIGLNAHDKKERARNYVQQEKIPWPNVFASDEMLKKLQVRGFPRYILLDKDNRIISYNISLGEVEAVLEGDE